MLSNSLFWLTTMIINTDWENSPLFKFYSKFQEIQFCGKEMDVELAGLTDWERVIPSISTAGTCCIGFNVLYCSVSWSRQKIFVTCLILDYAQYVTLTFNIDPVIVPADLHLWLDWLEPGRIQYLWEQKLTHKKFNCSSCWHHLKAWT